MPIPDPVVYGKLAGVEAGRRHGAWWEWGMSGGVVTDRLAIVLVLLLVLLSPLLYDAGTALALAP